MSASRSSNALRALAVCAALACASSPTPAAAQSPDVEVADPAAAPDGLGALLGAFATMPGLEAAFVEEKHIGLLAVPLRSEGRLYFLPPDRLLRRVESPRESEALVTASAVVFRDESGEQTLDLSTQPGMRALVESLVWLLAGDARALDAAYASTFTATAEGWEVVLTPRDEPLSHIISEMRIAGAGYAVERIAVHESNGDTTVTTVVNADPARVFDADERTALFGE